MSERRIKISYGVVTEESAEIGGDGCRENDLGDG